MTHPLRTNIKIGDKVLIARADAHWGHPHWDEAQVMDVSAAFIRVKLDNGRFFTPSGTETFLRMLEGVEWKAAGK